MYRILIVDDERLVIKSLKASIDWQEYGYSVIGEATSGKDALEFINKQKPDLVFTDIRMPEINGLELIKRGKRISGKTQFIVVSGYAEFAYAQKAMLYGAMGYCLKPFDDDEIINILKKVKAKLKVTTITNDYSLLDTTSKDNRESLIKILKENKVIDSYADNKVIILVSIGKNELEFSTSVSHVDFRLGPNKYVYIIPVDKRDYILSTLDISEDIKSVGISSIISIDENLNKYIENTTMAAYQFFITGKRDLYTTENIDYKDIDNLVRKLENSAGKKDINTINKTLDNISQLIKKADYNIKLLFRMYNVIMSLFYRIDGEYYERYIYNYEQLTGIFTSADDMIVYLRELLNSQLKLKPKYQPEKIKNKTFRDVLQYVNKNYCNDISIQSVSKKFVINPSYLSQMFRKEIKKTFTQYLTSLRMSDACELLKDTEYTINEIADKIGYNDYFYFAKTFKKFTGKTPGNYREEN
ncbi:response regulator transcription factor [Vallitalea guaymasensis]|uniref:Stage 0 sporulation protein A homolog n=1 Tax=Vallitalea guaymasensis TaxID=1185412 RepID=A0A8J8M7L3_9FIRM|nr:response regulator [Vallitalea guaymasensis]QUH27708.1 response regulator [Vallitalea guaymasensis]